MEYNILFAGVGGQGIITLGRLIGSALTNSGFNVLMAETHGLSQRGGSVTVHMRVGDVNSPLVPLGGADLLVGLELIEAVRNLSYLSGDGVKIVNDYIIRPSIPKIEIPSREYLINKLREGGGDTYITSFTEYALELGDIIYTNVIILGVITSLDIIPGLTRDSVIEVIGRLKNKEYNLKAFNIGYDIVGEIKME